MDHAQYLRERIGDTSAKYTNARKEGVKPTITAASAYRKVLTELSEALTNYESQPANIDTSGHVMD